MLGEDELVRLREHLSGVFGTKNIAIDACHRIHGGASRETYSIDARIDRKPRGLIIRRDPADSLIDTERALEFAAYRSFADSNVPVPAPISLVESADILGSPFFVMGRIDGGSAASPFAVDPFGSHRAAIGEQFFRHLGAIHAREAATSALAEVIETPAHGGCWKRELDYWEGVIDTDELEPQPIARAAIRQLRRTRPPPPHRQTIVHGDYRNGNFLHNGDGHIMAILDWEMAHIGDPMEDLAWALDPLWNINTPDLAAGMVARDEAIAVWQAASGLMFDEESYAWWSLFANVKGLGIWISAAKSYCSGKNMDPVLGFSGWFCTTHHNRVIAERLSGASL
jgi:aminoglycoside phosphotransferase (APT) family kinase protein